MNSDVKGRPFELYETENGNVPSDLRKICSGLGEFVDNLEDEKKKRLSPDDLGWIRTNLRWLRNGERSFSELKMLKRLSRVGPDLFVLKRTKGDANPRIYLTDLLPERYVILHGYKKDSYDQDPEEQKKAEDRLEDLRARIQSDGG